jgi:nucleoside-diphosphate-sugar epimerase
MKLLVLGGSRFIGRALVRQARAEGHQVVVFNRGKTDPEGTDITGDRRNLEASQLALRAVEADAVVDCIAYSEEDGRQLVSVFGDTRMVVLSSADCFAGFRRVVLGEDPGELPMRDHSALCTERHYWRGSAHHADDYDKNLMTAVVAPAGATVLRLPMVYGPGDHQVAYRHGTILHHLLAGRSRYVEGAVSLSTIWTYGYIENMVAAILHAVGHADPGEVYNLAEPSVRTRRRWVELYAAASGRPLEVVAVCDEKLEGSRIAAHLLVDGGRYRRDTGFVEPVPLLDGIARTWAWAQAHPEVLGPEPDFGAREAAIST